MNGRVISSTPNAWGMVEKSTDSVSSNIHTTIKLTLAGDNTHYAYVDADQRGDNELNFGPPLNVVLGNHGWLRADRLIKPYDKENSREAQNATAPFYLVVHNQY